MVGALVKGDNIKGLSERFDALVDEYPKTFDMIAETDFTTIFSKCWATSMATSWDWRVHLGFVRTSQAGGESAKEMSSTRLRRCRRPQLLLRQQPGRMVPAQPTGLPCLKPVRVPKLAPAILARAPCSTQRLLSQAAAADENKASMSLSKSLCARFEHSRAQSKQF